MIVLHKGRPNRPFRTVKTSLGIVDPNTYSNGSTIIDPMGAPVPEPQGPILLSDETGVVQPVEGWYWENDGVDYANSVIYDGYHRETSRAEEIGRIIERTAEWVLEHQDEALKLYQKVKGVPPPAIPTSTTATSTQSPKDNTLVIVALLGVGVLAALFLTR